MRKFGVRRLSALSATPVGVMMIVDGTGKQEYFLWRFTISRPSMGWAWAAGR